MKFLHLPQYRLVMLISTSICFCAVLHAQPVPQKKNLWYADDFNSGSDQWVLETEAAVPARMHTGKGQLMLDVPKDATLWFKRPLQGDLLIDFYREVIIGDGPYDRLSDMNFFWMASDPRNANLFTRDGIFRTYDSLRLYYAGIGGNFNTTTRFRKYTGDGQKKIIQEYADSQHLLQPNHAYHIQILVQEGFTAMWIDSQLYFHWKDTAPLQQGYFGIRTTKSRQTISAFRIYRL